MIARGAPQALSSKTADQPFNRASTFSTAAKPRLGRQPKSTLEFIHMPALRPAHAAPAPVLERELRVWRQVPVGCASYSRTGKAPAIGGSPDGSMGRCPCTGFGIFSGGKRH